MGFLEVSSHAFQQLRHTTLSELELSMMDACACLKKSIAEKRQEVRAAERAKDLKSNFSTTVSVEKPELQGTRGHNTLCGAPGCYCNCHLGCTLPRSLNKDIFLRCLAIRWRPGDRRLRHLRQGVVKARRGKVSDEELQRMVLNKSHIDSGTKPEEFCLKANVDVGKCFVCGHDFSQHHHEEAKWVLRKVEEELIDVNWIAEMKQQFLAAASSQERIEKLHQGLRQKQQQVEDDQRNVLEQVGTLLEKFDKLGVKSSYQQRLQATLSWVEQQLSEVVGGGNAELKTLHAELRQRFEIVQCQTATSKL